MTLVMKNIVLPDLDKPFELEIYVEGKDEEKLKEFLRMFGELWNYQLEQSK